MIFDSVFGPNLVDAAYIVFAVFGSAAFYASIIGLYFTTKILRG
jgi:hypothetical protein